MGCGGSKANNSSLVERCRERKELIKEASQHRYALAAAHLTYFYSLKDVGEAIRRFVEEELVVASGSSSTSPVLTLPSNEDKSSNGRRKSSSSSTSISHYFDDYNNLRQRPEEDDEDSHLHLSSESDVRSNSSSPHIHDDSSGHIHIDDSPNHFQIEGSQDEEERIQPGIYPPSYRYPIEEYPSGYSHVYHMKKSATPSQSFIYQDPETHQQTSGLWPDPRYGYSGYPPYPNEDFLVQSSANNYNPQPSPPPMPPSPPSVSPWDYLNVFDTPAVKTGRYPSFYPQNRYEYSSSRSSLDDLTEVREREGIPDLEDEIEQKGKRRSNEHTELKSNTRNINKNSSEGTSMATPIQIKGETSSSREALSSSSSSKKRKSIDFGAHDREEKSTIPYTNSSTNSKESTAKKGVSSSEVEEASTVDVESSKLSSLTDLSLQGTRDLQESVNEIKNEFETATSYGKEVAMLLEVGTLPYQRTHTGFKVIFSRILSSRPRLRSSIPLTPRTMKMAKAYGEGSDRDFNVKPRNLSSTLEKIYAWEKKLYKEVKEEERLRVIYEKEGKRLTNLDLKGAEPTKIDATRISMRKLMTKIDVCIKSINVISTRIHKLRDEELEPQLTELIFRLIRMWRSMHKCHKKQLQAIMESKINHLKASSTFQRDSGLKATIELELELLKWSARFTNLIGTQKSFVETLNKWLSKCIHYEPEETVDGVAPFSPGRIGAPPIFIVCNDWYQAMVEISEKDVEKTMLDFASSLHQLWERQYDEQQHGVKNEFISKDFKKQVRILRQKKDRLIQHDQDTLLEKTSLPNVHADNGVSPLDDLKVDLDTMRMRLEVEDERTRHNEAIKLVDNIASTSLQSGLLPIFEALDTFTLELLKTHEQVRLNAKHPH